VVIPLAILINTPPSSSRTSYHKWDDIPAPQTTSPVFTRRDDVGDEYSDWLVAKMWVRVANVHYHILGSLVTSRLLAETVSLAVYRCLPSVHPVRSLGFTAVFLSKDLTSPSTFSSSFILLIALNSTQIDVVLSYTT